METDLEKEKAVHDALHTHVLPIPTANKRYVHVTRCSCGMIWYGDMSEKDWRYAMDNDQPVLVDIRIIHESEEWIWLGRAKNNIDSIFPQLFQKDRKLWVYSQACFKPLKLWRGLTRWTRNSHESGKTSTVWKIAACRKVPLSIVLENTDPDKHEWVKENWKKWTKESRDEINDAVGKKKKVEEARELLKRERIKAIKHAKEQAKWKREHPEFRVNVG